MKLPKITFLKMYPFVSQPTTVHTKSWHASQLKFSTSSLLYLRIWNTRYILAISQILILHSLNITFILKIIIFSHTDPSCFILPPQFYLLKSYIFFSGKLTCGFFEVAFHFPATGYLKLRSFFLFGAR